MIDLREAFLPQNLKNIVSRTNPHTIPWAFLFPTPEDAAIGMPEIKYTCRSF
jgi:hypothetical protein